MKTAPISVGLALLVPALCAAAPVQDEIAPSGSIALPVPAAFQESPRLTGERDGSTVINGTSFAPGSIERFPFLMSVDADGALEWSWVGQEDDVQAVGLFVPSEGEGVFCADFDFTDEVRLRRFDDGVQTWVTTLDGDPWSGSPIYQPVIELTGPADGSRLFGLVERDFEFDLLVSLDPADGSVLWSAALPAISTPVGFACDATGSKLAVLCWTTSPVNSDSLFSYDGATGALLTTTPLTGEFGMGSPRNVAIDPAGTRAFVGGRAEDEGEVDLLAVDLSNGNLLWSTAVDASVVALGYDPVGPELIVVSTTLDFFVGQPLRVSAVRPGLGLVQWERVLDEPHRPGSTVRLSLETTLERAALHYDSTEGFTSPKLATLELFDLSDGASVATLSEAAQSEWSVIAGGQFQTIGGAPAFVRVRATNAGDGTDDVNVRAFSLAGGPALWSLDQGFGVAVPRVEALWALPGTDSAYATVIDSSADRHVLRVDLATNTIVWQALQEGPSIEFPNPAVGRALVVDSAQSVLVSSRTAFSTTDLPELLAVDAATGAALWSQSLDGLGNARDLALIEQPGFEPVVVSLHGNDGDSFGRTAMRAVQLDGDLAWMQEWPSSGSESWRAAALASAPEEGRVHGLVSSSFPVDEMRVLTRSLATGALEGNLVLEDSDFTSTLELGVPLAADLERDAASGELFVLGRYLGTVVLDSHLACARVDPAAGTVIWGVALDPSPLPNWDLVELAYDAASSVLVIVGSARAIDGQLTVVAQGLDAATGAELWTHTAGAPGDPRVLLDAQRSASGDALLISAIAGGASELYALDFASGAQLWSTIVDGETDADRAAWLASIDQEVLALVGAELAVPSGAASLERLATAELVGGPDAISVADPAPIALHLDRPQSAAGAVYLVLGSLTGTAPATPIGGLLLPLVADAYTTLCLTSANQGPFDANLGALSAAGDARAAVQLPGGLAAGLAGVQIHHAFLEFGPLGAQFVSQPVSATLAP